VTEIPQKVPSRFEKIQFLRVVISMHNQIATPDRFLQGQSEANSRNALKSTGPTTPEGKDHSRCNAPRHSLTAETSIAALEDAEDY
jgi:hypothetical protein